MKMMNNLMHYVYNKTIFKTVSLKCNANVKSMTGSKSRILKQFHYVVEEDYKAYELWLSSVTISSNSLSDRETERPSLRWLVVEAS